MTLVHTVLTQLSMKTGLLKFRERGKKSVKKYFLQLHEIKTLWPLKKDNMTKKKCTWNRYTNVSKIKNDKSVKARRYANGQEQRAQQNKKAEDNIHPDKLRKRQKEARRNVYFVIFFNFGLSTHYIGQFKNCQTSMV